MPVRSRAIRAKKEPLPPWVSEVRAWVAGVTRPKQVHLQSLANLGYDKQDPHFFREDFESALSKLMDEGLRILHDEQTKVMRRIIRYSDELAPQDQGRADDTLWQGIKSLENQRKKRAGVMMEGFMGFILRRCDIPFERGKPRTKRADLICPGLQAFDNFPEHAVILEFKRTLRERWKEVLDELAKTFTVWLVTLDRDLTEGTVREVSESRITLYVREDVYERLPKDPKHLRSIRTILTDIRGVVGDNPQTYLTQFGNAKKPSRSTRLG